MANYDLERLTVLMVEDSRFMSSLMFSALKALGVGVIKSASHGGEAIELLKLVKRSPAKAGVMEIDVVVTNWQMSPIDGLMLLRWIRRHPDSPNRFLPVVMVTGHSAIDQVATARDLGVTEFLTKPYSVNGLAARLIHVIEHPRQFVQTKDYFGPDRRRSKRPFGDKDRRILTEKSKEVEVVYG